MSKPTTTAVFYDETGERWALAADGSVQTEAEIQRRAEELQKSKIEPVACLLENTVKKGKAAAAAAGRRGVRRPSTKKHQHPQQQQQQQQ